MGAYRQSKGGAGNKRAGIDEAAKPALARDFACYIFRRGNRSKAPERRGAPWYFGTFHRSKHIT